MKIVFISAISLVIVLENWFCPDSENGLNKNSEKNKGFLLDKITNIRNVDILYTFDS